MKYIKRILVLILVLEFGIYIFNNCYLGGFSDSFGSIFNNLVVSANNKNLEDITELGDLISDKDTKSLEDSGIDGSDISINTLYYPYYAMLDGNEKDIYKQIYANVSKYKNTFIPVTDIDKDELKKSFMAVYYDHPELFWLSNEYSYKYTVDNRCVQVTISFNDTIRDINNAKANFENATNRIIINANKYASNYEKEKYVHDVLVRDVIYDNDSSLNQSAYSALVNKRSVCAGYTRAFQFIMIRLGIPTYYVVGRANEDHAWNIVYLDDGYYNVDVTWDDHNNISYSYFNRTDNEFASTHTRCDLSKYLPKCSAVKYRPIISNNVTKKSIKKNVTVISNNNKDITSVNSNDTVNNNSNESIYKNDVVNSKQNSVIDNNVDSNNNIDKADNKEYGYVSNEDDIVKEVQDTDEINNNE